MFQNTLAACILYMARKINLRNKLILAKLFFFPRHIASKNAVIENPWVIDAHSGTHTHKLLFPHQHAIAHSDLEVLIRAQHVPILAPKQDCTLWPVEAGLELGVGPVVGELSPGLDHQLWSYFRFLWHFLGLLICWSWFAYDFLKL